VFPYILISLHNDDTYILIYILGSNFISKLICVILLENFSITIQTKIMIMILELYTNSKFVIFTVKSVTSTKSMDSSELDIDVRELSDPKI
jgi:hypothetical protein